MMQCFKYCFLVMFFVAQILLFWNINILDRTSNVFKQDMVPVTRIISELILQRNALCSRLNNAMRDIGQLQCEKTNDTTDAQGGWCKVASRDNGREHDTDKPLIQVLSKFLKNKTVGSFGDGPGAYKREILKLGHVTIYEAYDGSPYCEETSEGRVKFLDLTIPQFDIPLYDWIISLEVAEHIPSHYESIFLDNIFRHAKEGIILSWALPEQRALMHINNRPLNYVINVMGKNGFIIDEESSKLLQESASFSSLKRNLYVYRKKNKISTNFLFL